MMSYFQFGWTWNELGRIFCDLSRWYFQRMSKEEFDDFSRGYHARNEIVHGVNYS